MRLIDRPLPKKCRNKSMRKLNRKIQLSKFELKEAKREIKRIDKFYEEHPEIFEKVKILRKEATKEVKHA